LISPHSSFEAKRRPPNASTSFSNSRKPISKNFESPPRPRSEDAAFQKGIELLFDELGPTCPGLQLDLVQEGIEVFLNQLIEGGVFGTPAFVVYAPCGWRGLNRFAHRP
jgi:hypothetical protein